MRKFRKKPVVIEAVQYTGDNLEQIEKETNGGAAYAGATQTLIVTTLEGQMRADVGDWIIRGVKGEFYPCKPDIFALTYEREPDAQGVMSQEERDIYTDDGCKDCDYGKLRDTDVCPGCGARQRQT